MRYIHPQAILLILCIAPFLAISQQKITETTESIGDLKGNALTIEILRAEEKDIQKEWKSIMKGYEGSVKTKGDKLYTSDAKIESISSGNVQINAEIGDEKNGKREFTVIFQSERGAVSSKSDISGYTAAKSIVESFANKLSLEAANKYTKLQENDLKKLQKEKDQLEKENKNLHSKIKKWNEEIKDAEYTIESNKKALKENSSKLTEQEKRYESSVNELNSIK